MFANRWRTLLLNLPAAEIFGPGEEYVTPDFMPRTFTADVTAIWQTLFGRDPDRAYRNYLLYQYAQVAHSSKFQDDIIDLDHRVTYWPAIISDARWSAYGRLYNERLSGSGTLTLGAVPYADDVGGRSSIDIHVAISGTSLVANGQPVTLSFSSGLAVTALPHWSGISVYVNTGTEGTWRISGNLRPRRSPATSVTQLNQIQQHLSVVFGVDDRNKELGEQFKAARSAPDRLSPVLVALGRKIAIDRGEDTGGE